MNIYFIFVSYNNKYTIQTHRIFYGEKFLYQRAHNILVAFYVLYGESPNICTNNISVTKEKHKEKHIKNNNHKPNKIMMYLFN